MDQTEENAPNVGARIRNLRASMGISLRTLADRCGLSINAISRIERGANSPTVSSLHRLASALEVPITRLFDDEDQHQVLFVRKESVLRTNLDGLVIESLAVGLNNQMLEPFKMVVKPGLDLAKDSISHKGQEFVHCLAGKIDYLVNGVEYTLAEGDSLLFEAVLPHSWRNPYELAATVIMVFQSVEQRLQARRVHLEPDHHE